MGGPFLAHRRNDTLAALKQLAHKLQADASTRAEDQPSARVPVGIENIWDLVHRDGQGRGNGVQAEVVGTLKASQDGLRCT